MTFCFALHFCPLELMRLFFNTRIKMNHSFALFFHLVKFIRTENAFLKAVPDGNLMIYLVAYFMFHEPNQGKKVIQFIPNKSRCPSEISGLMYRVFHF